MYKRFPSDRQLDLQDCGPACLKIISRHYGKYYSLPYLRDVCGISKEGVSFLDISYAAEKIGLRSLSIRLSFEDFQNKIPLPCIIHWSGSHFVVVYKFTKDKVFVSDPAKGLLTYTKNDFKKHWQYSDSKHGILMALEPQADFYQREAGEKVERLKSLENFIGYFRPYRKSFTLLLIVMLVVTLLQGLLPFIAKAVIDVGIQTNDLSFIDLVLVANVAIIISVLLANIVRDWIVLHITARINISLISDYLIKLMGLPITFFESKLVGDILERANDHERIRSFLMDNSLNLLFSGLTFIVFGGILLNYNDKIFYIFIIGSIIYTVWILFFLKVRKRLDWEYFDIKSKNQSYWIETINSIQDIKINNYEKQRRWKWESIQAKLYKINVKVLSVSNTQNLGAQFINSLTNLFITFYCAKAVIGGEITFGVMISTQFIIGMLNGPVVQFINFIQSAQSAKLSFMRLNEIHVMDDEEEESISNSILIPEIKSLLIRSVSFQYTRNSPYILKNINLVIPEGKVTAIVGDSGSGKTTLLKLILRLYEPSVGMISIGDLNIKNISLKQWRNACGSVMQDGKIFNDTILNNIVLEEEKPDIDRLKKAVSAANIAWEIENLPQGYQTMMGESGRGLSGGQKQRILIARALYKNPDYLFFDEATNSLDSINEQKIVAALDDVFKEKTVVVVAHRLSTIQKAHQIIVLKNGSIIEIGNHEVLMEKNGYYTTLVASQNGGLLNA